MSNLPSHPDQSDGPKTAVPIMRFGKQHVHRWAVYSSLGILGAVLFVLISYLGVSYQVTQPQYDGLSENKTQEPVLLASEEKRPSVNHLIAKLKYLIPYARMCCRP